MAQRPITHIPIYKLLDITSPDAGELIWSHKPFPENHPFYIPGVFTDTLSGKWGAIVFQHMLSPYYDFWLSYYDIYRPVTFFSTGNIMLTEICFEIRNSKLHEVFPFHRIYCIEGTYNLYQIPNIKSRVYFSETGPVVTFDVHLSLLLLEKLKRSFPRQIQPVITALQTKSAARLFQEPQVITPEIEEHLNRLISSLHNEGANADLRDVVYPLLHACLSKPESKVSREKSGPVSDISSLCKSIQVYFPNRYSLAELARNMCMSRSSFIRAFVKETGTTVKKYYTQLAMATAMHLVQNSKRSVAQIANDTGYTNSKAFARAFKIHYHKAPIAFRKK